MTTEVQSTEQSTAASLEQRAAAIIEESNAERLARQDQGGAAPGSEASPAGEPAAPPTEAEQRAKARREELDRLAAGDKAKAARRAEQAEKDRLARELHAEREHRTQLEARMASMIAADQLTPEAFFDLASKAKVDPVQLGRWLQDITANPERVAIDAAQKAAEKATRELLTPEQEKVRELERRLAAYEAQKANEEDLKSEESFIATVNAETAPHAARLVAQDKEAFRRFARNAAMDLPPGSGWDKLLRYIELQFEEAAALFQVQQPHPNATKPKSATAKATTISNAIASDRASLPDESDEKWSSLTVDQRAELLKRGHR